MLENQPRTKTLEDSIAMVLDQLKAAPHSDVALAIIAAVKGTLPEVYNAVLCRYFNISCYKLSETFFADRVAKEDLSKWFVAFDVGSVFDTGAIPPDLQLIFDTLALAEEAAVKAFGLAARFVEAEVNHDRYRAMVD